MRIVYKKILDYFMNSFYWLNVRSSIIKFSNITKLNAEIQNHHLLLYREY